MIPWALYNLTPRDQGSPLIRPFFTSQNLSGVGVTFLTFADVVVPAEQILLVTHFHCDSKTTVAAQWECNTAIRTVNSLLRAEQTYRKDPSAFTFTQNVDVAGAPLWMLNGGDRIQVTALSGVAGNQNSILSIAGVMIPRGTISLT